MATTTLIVVIVILTWNLAILYLPFTQRMKAKLSLGSVALLLMFCVCNANKGDEPRQNVYRQIAWQKAHNPQAAQAMMTAFNVSEEEFNTKANKPTPIEAMVYSLLALALLTPLLVNVVIMDSDDEQKTEKGLQWIFALNVVAAACLLSLFYGLKLTLVPWYKKVLKEEKSSLALTSKESAQSYD